MALGAVLYTVKFFCVPRAALSREAALQIFNDQFDEVERRFGFSFERYTTWEGTETAAELCGDAVLETGETMTLQFGMIGSYLTFDVYVQGDWWDTWEEADRFVQQRDLEQYARVFDMVSYLGDGLYGGDRMKKTLTKLQEEVAAQFPERHEGTVSAHRSIPLSIFFPKMGAYLYYDADEHEETGKWTTLMGVGMMLYARGEQTGAAE